MNYITHLKIGVTRISDEQLQEMQDILQKEYDRRIKGIKNCKGVINAD